MERQVAYNPDLGDAGEFLSKHTKLVRYVVNMFNRPDLYDDLYGAGLLGMTKAYKTYKASANVKWATYAVKCIRNEILMLLRSQKRHKSTISLDAPISEDFDGNELSLKEILVGDEIDGTQIEIAEFLKTLKGREAQVVSLRLAGKTQEEVGEALSLSRSYISRILSELKLKYNLWKEQKIVKYLGDQEKATELLKAGKMTHRQICDITGVPLATLSDIRRRLGIAPKPKKTAKGDREKAKEMIRAKINDPTLKYTSSDIAQETGIPESVVPVLRRQVRTEMATESSWSLGSPDNYALPKEEKAPTISVKPLAIEIETVSEVEEPSSLEQRLRCMSKVLAGLANELGAMAREVSEMESKSSDPRVKDVVSELEELLKRVKG